MPRYFFNVRSKAGFEADEVGVEFDTLEEAIADARRARTEMVVDEVLGQQTRPTDGWFEISDEAGQVIATVPLLDDIS
jgi:uncharacterized protein DUF6894